MIGGKVGLQTHLNLGVEDSPANLKQSAFHRLQRAVHISEYSRAAVSVTLKSSPSSQSTGYHEQRQILHTFLQEEAWLSYTHLSYSTVLYTSIV